VHVPLAQVVEPVYELPPHCPYKATLPLALPLPLVVPFVDGEPVATAAAPAMVDERTTVWRVVLALHADFEDETTTGATTEVDLALQADLVDEALAAGAEVVAATAYRVLDFDFLRGL
jgi:hypothetical protein